MVDDKEYKPTPIRKFSKRINDLSEEIAKDAIKQEMFKQKYSNEIGKNYNENVNPNMRFYDENKEKFMNPNMRVYDENKKKIMNSNKTDLAFTPPPSVDFSQL